MDFVSIRLVTEDTDRMVRFYEMVSGQSITRHTDTFAELTTSSGTIAIADVSTLAVFGKDIARPADNHTVIIEFRVDDVDREFARLKESVAAFVQEPTTMPWGNRSLLFRDPDGNLVNLFTPVTAEAAARADR